MLQVEQSKARGTPGCIRRKENMSTRRNVINGVGMRTTVKYAPTRYHVADKKRLYRFGSTRSNYTMSAMVGEVTVTKLLCYVL